MPVDLSAVLGVSGTSLSGACRASSINMWAKYKPVCWPNVDTTDALNGTSWNPNAAAAKQWWRSADGNFGLLYNNAKVDIPYPATSGATQMISGLNSLLAKIDGNMNGWEYEKPFGGAREPYRLLDFLQYNHNAPNPIRKVEAKNVSGNSKEVYEFEMKMMRSAFVDITTRDYIMPEDLTGSTLYMGLAIYKKSGSSYSAIAWAIDSNVWQGKGVNASSGADGIINGSTMDSDLYVETKLKDGVTYYALPFLCTRQLDQPAAGQSYVPRSWEGLTLITSPYTSLQSFEVHQTPSGQLIAYPRLSNSNISTLWTFSTNLILDATVQDYTGGTATDVRLAIVNELYDGTFAQGNYAGQGWYTFGNVTVPANSTVTVGRVPSSGLLTLDSAHSWKAIALVSGYEKTLNLRPPRQNEA